MPTHEDNHCPNCIWFDKMDAKGGGLCRKHAPVVIPRVEQEVGGLIVTKAHTSFPYVRSTDWCGEHQLDTSL